MTNREGGEWWRPDADADAAVAAGWTWVRAEERRRSTRADLPGSAEQRFASGWETPEEFFARRDAERLRAREEWEARPYDTINRGGMGAFFGSHPVKGRTRRNAEVGIAAWFSVAVALALLGVLLAVGVLR